MKKAELIEQIAKNEGITRTEAKQRVESVFFAVHDAIIMRREVSLTGIGKIFLKQRGARNVRNPKTGTYVEKAAHDSVHFSPSSTLKRNLAS